MSAPDHKYVMRYRGQMRPVTYMIDRSNKQTLDTAKAVKAIIYVADDKWIATTCHHSEIVPRIFGPDTKYMMQWKGEWRPVVDMLDARGIPTTLAIRAERAVLYIHNNYWVRCNVFPGDIVERHDRDPEAREWDWVD